MAHQRQWEESNAWIRAGEVALFPLTHLLGRRRYRGALTIPETGPALVVANHISHLDPIFDVVYVRTSGRIPRVLAKASLWDIPVVGRVLAGTGQIPVARGGGSGQAALTTAVDALEHGKVVLIYPEGTVTKDPDYWPMRPRPGVASLALAGDFPVIPVVHWGSHEVYSSYRPGRRFRPLPRKTVRVLAGEPIDLSAWRGKPVDKRAIRDVSYLIMGRIRDMLAEIRREPAPATFYQPTRRAGEAGEELRDPAGEAGGTSADATGEPPADGTDEPPAEAGPAS